MAQATKGGQTDSKGMSRRAFLSAAGLMGLAVGATGAFAGSGSGVAYAGEPVGSAEGNPNAGCMETFGPDTAYLPVKKAEWTQLNGPIGFEAEPVDPSKITRTDTCDFLVIGVGIGGMTAGLHAADEGANVIGIEKMSEGRMAWESVGGYNTKLQQEIGNVPDPAEYMEAIMRASMWRARADAVWGFIQHSGAAIDFLNDMVVKAGKGVSYFSTEQAPALYKMDVIQAEHKINVPEGVEWKSWLKGGFVWDSLLATAATYPNFDIRYNTAGVQLTQDATGRVTGAIAKDAEGYYAIEASKGVLLSTGGYEANPTLMQAWMRPEDYQTAEALAPCMGPTGDGHMMGLAVGAAMDPVPHCLMSFRSVSQLKANKLLSAGIWVNHRGQRFVNESLPFNYAANAINIARIGGHPVWFLFDSSIVESRLEAMPTLKDDIAAMKAEGTMVEGATIEELAVAMGADPAELAAAVEAYNGYFDAGETRDLQFNRDISKLTPLAQGPFYAGKHTNQALVTVSGLIINEHGQVLNEDDEAIEGLYATGNASGGLFSDAYPRHLPATSTGRAVTFGYAAADHALKGE